MRPARLHKLGASSLFSLEAREAAQAWGQQPVQPVPKMPPWMLLAFELGRARCEGVAAGCESPKMPPGMLLWLDRFERLELGGGGAASPKMPPAIELMLPRGRSTAASGCMGGVGGGGALLWGAPRSLFASDA